MKMKYLSDDHYIVIDDSDIKIGDIVAEKLLTGEYELFTIHTLNDIDKSTQKKITHSTQPLGFLNEHGFTTANLKPDWTNVEYLPLSEVKEVLGVVDVEKKALEISPVKLDEDEFDVNETHRVTWIDGYTQALKDNKERKYTRNEVHALMCKAFEQALKKADVLEAGLEGKETDVECAWILTRHDSTPKKTEWEVKMVDGKLKLKL